MCSCIYGGECPGAKAPGGATAGGGDGAPGPAYAKLKAEKASLGPLWGKHLSRERNRVDALFAFCAESLPPPTRARIIYCALSTSLEDGEGRKGGQKCQQQEAPVLLGVCGDSRHDFFQFFCSVSMMTIPAASDSGLVHYGQSSTLGNEKIWSRDEKVDRVRKLNFLFLSAALSLSCPFPPVCST